MIVTSSKVRKLRRERERSVSPAVPTAGQTMPKVSDLGEIPAVTMRLGVG